jgi:hypothetical protein
MLGAQLIWASRLIGKVESFIEGSAKETTPSPAPRTERPTIQSEPMAAPV